MRESIGSTFLYNMIFVFIIIVFGILSATMSYYKGYKVNTRILKYLSQYSGYNSVSYAAINNYLGSIGYTDTRINNIQESCPDERNGGGKLVKATDAGLGDPTYAYCVYYFGERPSKDGTKTYYSYGVISYIYVDLPIAGQFKIPVYSRGDRIYKFSGDCQRGVNC